MATKEKNGNGTAVKDERANPTEKRTRAKGNFKDLFQFCDMWESAKDWDEAERLTGLKRNVLASKVSGIEKKLGIQLRRFNKTSSMKKEETRKALIALLARKRNQSEVEIERAGEQLKAQMEKRRIERAARKAEKAKETATA